jgi:predicted lipoprotein with Yx(FWY)xxD motif
MSAASSKEMNPLSLNTLRSRRRTFWLGAAAVVAATTLSACASSSGGSAAPGAGGGTGSSGAASTALTIETHSGPLGTFLTDGSGKTLYMFASDTSSKSTCSGPCAVFWPPVTDTATPTVSGTASMSDVGSIMRADGSTQVTYNGHPLYYFKDDSGAGDTSGQGNNTFGAKWWVLSAKGTPIEGAASSGGAPSPASPASKSSSSSSAPAAGGWA